MYLDYLVGKEIEVTNKDNTKTYKCKILEIKEELITCKVLNSDTEIKKSNIEITIYQGLPKQEKMEYIIQKAVELGVNNIVPIKMERCIVKLDSNSEMKKIERWNKISEAAAKQSKRNEIPRVNSVVNIKQLEDVISKYDKVLIAYELETENTLKKELQNIKKLECEKISIAIIIGPEGGITKEEVERLENYGAVSITLGKRILRTETVALNVISIIMYELEEI